MQPDNYQGSGIYRHYKGGEYEVIGLALSEETVNKDATDFMVKIKDSEIRVIYKPLSEGSLLPIPFVSGDLAYWSRELSDFNEWVEVYGGVGAAPRFRKISDAV